MLPMRVSFSLSVLPKNHLLAASTFTNSQSTKLESRNSNYEKHSSVVLRIVLGRLRDASLVLLLQLFATDAATGFQ
jgi:hypothetical protein